MIEKNVVEEYVHLCNRTKMAEASFSTLGCEEYRQDFFENFLLELYESFGDVGESLESYSDKTLAGMNQEAKDYPKLYEEHKLGKHPFIQFLNEQYHYQSAVNAFCSKEIMASQTFVHTRGSKKNISTPPLPNIFFLNAIIADCYLLSEIIDDKGISAFITNRAGSKRLSKKSNLIEKIRNLSLMLMEDIDESKEAELLETLLTSTLRNNIEGLDNYERLARSKEEHQNRNYELYFAARNHEKAKRQVLCNFLVHRYAEAFVVKTKTYKRPKSSSTKVRYNRTKSFENMEVPTPYKPDPLRKWVRQRGFINADVLIEVIAMVNGDDDLDSRQIQRARQQLYESIDST